MLLSLRSQTVANDCYPLTTVNMCVNSKNIAKVICMQKGSKLIYSLAGQPCLLVFIIPNMKHQVQLTTQTMQQHPVIFLICINNDNEKIINMYIDEAMYMYNFVALHYRHGSVQRQGALIIISEWGTNWGGTLQNLIVRLSNHMRVVPHSTALTR